MKILAIGDPHGDLNRIKKLPLKGVDLILLPGDLGSANLARKMAFENIERKKAGLPEIEYSPQQRKKTFMEIYNSSVSLVKYLVKYAPVFWISGNVEQSNADTREESKEIGIHLPFSYDAINRIKGARGINNRIANFNGIRIGGLEYFVDASWVREFKPADYEEKLRNAKKESAKAMRVLGNFGKVDILVCHQPPYGVLDRVTAKFAPKHWRGKRAGSKVILDYIKKKQPNYVFCGHIHEGEGVKRVGRTEIYNLGFCGYKIISV